ncbi:MAG: sugar-binding protein [Micropruina sp.]|uniref:sugar-binding protein n=1 Tax=Micropruina sp. TaxID=2737536 RepID=UPI0039E5CBB3
MADPLISLDAELTSVQPGGQTRVAVSITNTGSVVDGYQLQVLGPSAAWARVEPAEVSVYPKQQASVTVAFQPPAGAGVAGGRHGYGVIARSTLDPQYSAVAEGVVEVAEVSNVQSSITPATSSGYWQGRHQVTFANAGNSALQLRVDAVDPDETLGFRIRPASVTLPPGGQSVVEVRAIAKKPFLWRTPARRPFRVYGVRADGQPAASVDAAFNHRPSGWMGVTSAVVVLLSVLTLLAPQILPQFVTTSAAAAPSLAARGAPPKPVITVRTTTDPASARVDWKPLESADKYRLQQVEPDGTVSTDPLEYTGDRNSATVSGLAPTNPDRTVCFKLMVTRAGKDSAWSDPVCVKLPPPPASQTPTPTPTLVDPNQPTLTAIRGSQLLDGTTNTWPWTTESNARFLATAKTTSNVTAKTYLSWDDTALYVMAKVTDSRLTQPGADPATIWRGDAITVELGLIRPTSLTDPLRASDRYYMFAYRTPPAGPPYIAESLVGVQGPNTRYTSFDKSLEVGDTRAVVAKDPDGGGYLLTARIVWPFAQVPPRDGLELAANINISDRTQDGETAMISTNPQRVGTQRYPAYWQRLTLKEQ